MADFNFNAMPAQEAVDFFRQKGLAIGFSWKDIEKEEHAIAFTVAKAMKIDILNDLKLAVEDALKTGKTFPQFQKEITPLLQKKGWWGVRKEIDPLDGKKKRVQLGSPRRLQIIYDTNFRMAHAAGRWTQIERTKKAFPYLRYVAVLDERTRPKHKSWHSIILPVDHPFWKTHYPPNGWRCRCMVQQVSEAKMKQKGWTVSSEAEIARFKETMPYVNSRTGLVDNVPLGIDPGFNYNVGQARQKAFTPPPEGGVPNTFPVNVLREQLPSATKVPAHMLLPEGESDDFYIDRFLAQFGATQEKPVIFTDKSGFNVPINTELFKGPDGESKVKKLGRQKYVLLMAELIRDPDEIWLEWAAIRQTKPDGSKFNSYRLKRRYLKHWDVDGEKETGIGSFWLDRHGWIGSTIFRASSNKGTPESRSREKAKYLEKQRYDLLMYRKNKTS